LRCLEGFRAILALKAGKLMRPLGAHSISPSIGNTGVSPVQPQAKGS
jgi:hypothetical protein